MIGEKAGPLPLVPDVSFPADAERGQQLNEEWGAALDRRDRRGIGEVELEQAHRNMVRRDACLTRLVRSVQTGDGEDVALYAQLHGDYAHFMQAEIDDAKRHVREESQSNCQQEAER